MFGRKRSKKKRDARLVRPPSVLDALKASLYGSGAVEWVSRPRRRMVQISLITGSLLLGMMAAALVQSLPDGALDATSKALIVGIAVVGFVVYVIHDVAMGMELIEKRQVETDLGLARQIQLRMLPAELPDLPGYRLDVFHEAARSVAGDAYDVLPLDDEHVFLTVADVSGKGTAAAMLMSGLLARTRALARTSMPLAELASRVSAALDQETEPHHFATLVVIVVELPTGLIQYVNAGNQPPLLVRRDGSRTALTDGGIPVGMIPNVSYVSGRAFLGAGDRLVLATDGVFDADDTGAPLLTEDELVEFTANDGGLDRVRDEVHRRTPDGRFDDLTVMTIRRDA